MVYLRSLDDESEYAGERREWEAKSRKAGCVRMSLSGGFLFKVGNDGTTQVKSMTRMDIKMPLIPDAVIDFVMKKVAVQILPFMNKQAGKFEQGGKLHHYIAEHRDVYDEMHRRLRVIMETRPS
eukprot:2674670-Prymnesium_polylepis.1